MSVYIDDFFEMLDKREVDITYLSMRDLLELFWVHEHLSEEDFDKELLDRML